MHEPIGSNYNGPVFLPISKDAPHTYVIGFTGAGKSELLKAIAYAYIKENNSAVVIMEPSGKFCKEIARWREWVGNTRLVYFHPRLATGMVPCINPFETRYTDRTDEVATNIKRVLARQVLSTLAEVVASKQSGTDVTGPMGSILYNCILTLMDWRDSDGNHATLRDLIAFVDAGEKQGKLVVYSDRNKELVRFGQTRTHYEGFPDYFTNRFRQGNEPSKRAIGNRLDTLITGTFFGELTCGKSTIDLEEAIEYQKVILFNLGKDLLSSEESQTFGRLVIALIKGIAMRRDFGKKHDPLHLIVDECHNYVTESMEEVLRESRKYQLYLTAAQVSIGDGMTPQLAKLMRGQTHVHIVGQVQRDDLRDIRSFIGCEPEEISKLSRGEFYMSVGNRAPVRFAGRSDLVGFTNSMTVPSWACQVERQLERYYRPKYGAAKFEPEVAKTLESQDEAPPPTATTSDDDEIRPGSF